MHKKFLKIMLIFLLILTLQACKKAEEVEHTTVATTSETIVETTETIPAIDREDVILETEPAVNKATIITGNAKESTETTEGKKTDSATQPTTGKTEKSETNPTVGKKEESTTEPTVVEEPTTEPASGEEATETNPVEGKKPQPSQTTEYERFMAMSGSEQMDFMYSFASIDDFLNWLEVAEAEYESARPNIVIGEDGVIDVGALFG